MPLCSNVQLFIFWFFFRLVLAVIRERDKWERRRAELIRTTTNKIDKQNFIILYRFNKEKEKAITQKHLPFLLRPWLVRTCCKTDQVIIFFNYNITLFFIRTTKLWFEAGCSQFFANFQPLFLKICSEILRASISILTSIFVKPFNFQLLCLLSKRFFPAFRSILKLRKRKSEFFLIQRLPKVLSNTCAMRNSTS